MDNILNVIIFSTLILFIEIYSETHQKNYGTLLERGVFLIGVKNIFNITKFSIFFSFLYVIFDSNRNLLDANFIMNNIINIDKYKIHYYLIPTFGFTILSIMTNSKEIVRQLQVYRFDKFEKLNQLLSNIKYVLFRIVSFLLTLFLFIFFLKWIIKLDELFKSKKIFFLDWLSAETIIADNYYKGVYFSLVLTLIFFFLFNNSFLKKNSNFWNYRIIKLQFFKYFFISLMLSLGLFFGFFSIFNALFNIFNSEISEWITKENILGILPIRISSVLITIYLLNYIYKEVLNRNLIDFLLLGILPIRQISQYDESINFNKSETLFFSQISFYILNIALAEIFIILNYKDIYLSILNFAILFIIDDFKIINDYSSGLHRVMLTHFIRVWLFNIIMLATAISVLSSNEYYGMLGIYLLFTFILFRYYLINSSSISFKNGLY